MNSSTDIRTTTTIQSITEHTLRMDISAKEDTIISLKREISRLVTELTDKIKSQNEKIVNLQKIEKKYNAIYDILANSTVRISDYKSSKDNTDDENN